MKAEQSDDKLQALNERSAADDQREEQDKNSEKKSLMAQVASSIGEFNYQLDVNPIVMSKAPDPLASFDDNELKAQDEFFEEQQKKHRQTMHQLSLLAGMDINRQLREKVDENKRRHEKTSLIQAIIAGRDPNEFVKEVNKQSDSRHAQHQRVKKQLQTDVQQQEAGVDANIRQEARDDQVEDAIDQSVKSGTINGSDVVGVKSSGGREQLTDSQTVQDVSVDTGEQEKVVVGQDDQTLINSDNAAYDPVDLLQNIQANFEIINAQQTVINSQPMINLDLRLGSIPSKVRDKNGFVVDLSKKDIAQIKAQLAKRLHKTMQYPVSIKTFNSLVAGNSKQSYSKTELSNTILKGYHIDFSKSISEDSPLRFKAPVLVNKQDQQIKPDFEHVVTPVDDQMQLNKQQAILRQEAIDLQANSQSDQVQHSDHSSEHLFGNQNYQKFDDPELSN